MLLSQIQYALGVWLFCVNAYRYEQVQIKVLAVCLLQCKRGINETS